MARPRSNGSVGGCLFSVFNIGFTVFMFTLPTIGLAYWYLYLRNPNADVAPRPPVQLKQEPIATKNAPNVDRRRLLPENPDQPITSGFFDEMLSNESSDRSMASDPDVQPPARKEPARKEYATRSWTDENGDFSIEARFYSLTGDQVKIVTDNDRQIEVPITRLSEADKEYLRSIVRNKGLQPKF